MKVQYLSTRGNPLKEREGDPVTDQFPGNERRFVFERFNGKQIMVGCKRGKVWQRRDGESKWTKIGRPVGFIGRTTDYCPACDTVTDGEVRYRNAVVNRAKVYGNKVYRSKSGEWRFECDCGEISDLRLRPDEPDYPEPDSTDDDDVIEQIQAYAEVCNREIFNNEIDLSRVRFDVNHRWKRVGGRANGTRVTIGMRKYERHGWNEVLDILRHELIHVWQRHADQGMNGGHDAQFHSWLVPARTKRHCM